MDDQSLVDIDPQFPVLHKLQLLIDDERSGN
jgi:hypothetical protein